MEKFEFFGIDAVEKYLDLGSRDPRLIATDLINTSLSFLGILTVVILLWGGFKWMLAGGKEGKVAEARRTIISCIIGLIIILTAWSATDFILTGLLQATQ
jgi:hypothetical protein